MRLKLRLSASPSVLTSVVLPVPGTPSISTWPPAKSADQQFLDRLLVADDHLVDLGLDTPERAGEIAPPSAFRACYVAHRSNTRLIVVRSSAGTAARAIGSSGCWFVLSGVRTLGGT